MTMQPQQQDEVLVRDYQSHEEGSDSPVAKRRKKGHTMEALLSREVGLMRDGAGSTSATFVGSASGIHFIRAVYGAVGTPLAAQTSPEANLVPGEDDRLASEAISGAGKHIWHQNEVDIASRNPSSPSFDNLVEWATSYFDAWHPIFPLLHAPSVLANFEAIARDGISSIEPWDVTITKAILSLGLADRRQSNSPLSTPLPKDLVFVSFEEALLGTQDALSKPATVKGLQAVVGVQLFLVSMLRLNAAARLGGLVVQMAFQLGLHRCPMRWHSFSQEDRQLRKRLFWSTYCLERYISQALGLPLTLRDEDVDVCYPNRELHDVNLTRHHPSSNAASHAKPFPEDFDERLELLVFVAKHAQLRGSIIELRNKRVEERDRNPDTAIFIHAKLMEWWNEIEDFFDKSASDTDTISLLHRTILESLKHESIIMLNRPLLALPKHTAAYAGAVHACIGAAKSLLSTLSSLLQPSGSRNGHQIPMMWPSFTWAAWMSAFIMFYGSVEGKLNPQAASRSIEKSLKVLKRLETRGSVWPEACAVAIKDLSSVLNRRGGTASQSLLPPNQPVQSPPSSRHSSSLSSIDSRNVQQVPASREWNLNASLRQEPTAARSHHPTVHSDNDPRTQLHGSQYHTANAATNVSQSLQTGLNNGNSGGFPNANPEYDVSNFGQSQQQQFTEPMDDQAWLSSSLFPKDVPPPAFSSVDPFQGFDIPFWVGQDNYLSWMGDNN